ncbi:hypothetical protein [Desulfovibrio sp. SGI.169]|uniref:hypothetical protein n=1 Tax=Desulfovibrio sp. SGI.169 TaxID=3420561 RepID=UPI003D06BBEA
MPAEHIPQQAAQHSPEQIAAYAQRLSRAAAVPAFSHAAQGHAPGQPENIERPRPDHPGRVCGSARQGKRRAACKKLSRKA